MEVEPADGGDWTIMVNTVAERFHCTVKPGDRVRTLIDAACASLATAGIMCSNACPSQAPFTMGSPLIDATANCGKAGFRDGSEI